MARAYPLITDIIPASNLYWSNGESNEIFREAVVDRRQPYVLDEFPIEYDHYESEILNPLTYKMFQDSTGWRVAVPRNMDARSQRTLLHDIFVRGPNAFGYVVVGDTLVPSLLNPVDRYMLASTFSN